MASEPAILKLTPGLQPPPAPPTLLTLPAEIRMKIFEYCTPFLSANSVVEIEVCPNLGHEYWNPEDPWTWISCLRFDAHQIAHKKAIDDKYEECSLSSNTVGHNLLLVNKQIFEEAKSLFLGKRLVLQYCELECAARNPPVLGKALSLWKMTLSVKESLTHFQNDECWIGFDDEEGEDQDDKVSRFVAARLEDLSARGHYIELKFIHVGSDIVHVGVAVGQEPVPSAEEELEFQNSVDTMLRELEYGWACRRNNNVHAPG